MVHLLEDKVTRSTIMIEKIYAWCIKILD